MDPMGYDIIFLKFGTHEISHEELFVLIHRHIEQLKKMLTNAALSSAENWAPQPFSANPGQLPEGNPKRFPSKANSNTMDFNPLEVFFQYIPRIRLYQVFFSKSSSSFQIPEKTVVFSCFF